MFFGFIDYYREKSANDIICEYYCNTFIISWKFQREGKQLQWVGEHIYNVANSVTVAGIWPAVSCYLTRKLLIQRRVVRYISYYMIET